MRDRSDGDDAVGSIEMQLVADPGLLVALAVAFDPDITLGWQPGAHLVERLCAAARCGLAARRQRTSSLRGRPACAWAARAVASRPGIGGRVFHALRSRSVARDMTYDMIPQMTTDELLMHPIREVLGGELGKGARDGCLAGTVGAFSRICVAVHDRSADARSGRYVVGMVSTALATKLRAMAGRSSGGRPRPRDGGANEGFQPECVEDDNELLSLAVRVEASSSPGSSLRWRLIQVP